MRLIDAEIGLNRYQEICKGTACLGCPFNNEGCALEKLILEYEEIEKHMDYIWQEYFEMLYNNEFGAKMEGDET